VKLLTTLDWCGDDPTPTLRFEPDPSDRNNRNEQQLHHRCDADDPYKYLLTAQGAHTYLARPAVLCPRAHSTPTDLAMNDWRRP
jgi:hypothetical protein